MNFKEFEDGLQVEIKISEKVPKALPNGGQVWYQESLEHFSQNPLAKFFLKKRFILYKITPIEFLPAVCE
jgi:hypothetical protein